MAYLNLDPDYFGHPKTKRIIGMLGKRAEIFPIRLWCYCAKYHAADGRLNGCSVEEIEGLADWDGEKGELVSALIKVGFLKKKGGIYAINDWLDHEGHIVKFKERSKLAAKKRWDRIITPSNATSNAKDKPKQSPLPNLTLPNPTNNTTPQEIYSYYSKIIKHGAKEDAIKSIIGLLKTGITKEDLLARVDAYKQDLIRKGTEDKFYIQANNFFGRAARYKDFDPIKKVEYDPADLNCNACKGQGWLQTGEGQLKRCNCVKEKT